MRETIRCCIACILPCGALDVIRIVHANGRVEEIGHTVKAADVMQQHPKHVLRKPPATSTFEEGGGGGDGAKSRASAAVILPPTAELERGEIYFLIPLSSVGQETAKPRGQARRRKRRDPDGNGGGRGRGNGNGNEQDTAGLLLSDRYLTEIMSESSTQRDRSSGRRAGVWRPHLESISEVDRDLQ